MISDYDVVLTVTAVAVSTAATTMTDETKGERKHSGQTDIDYNRRKLKGHYEIVSDRLMSTFNIDTEM